MKTEIQPQNTNRSEAFRLWMSSPMPMVTLEISNWFKGFEKGIARLSPEERSAFFSECGKNCVNGGMLSIYKKLYEDAEGDMDIFFQMANELPGVKGEVVEKGRVAAQFVERQELHRNALSFHLGWCNRLRNEN